MTIHDLGGGNVGTFQPAVLSGLGPANLALLAEVAALGQDVLALTQDVQAVLADLGAAEADVASAQGIVTDLTGQLAGAASSFASQMQAVADSITSGTLLLSIVQAIALGVPGFIASLESALASAVAKVTGLAAKVSALAARVAGIQARIAAIQARAASLSGVQLTLVNLLSLFATAGVHGYSYTGQLSNFGTELVAAVAGGIPGGAAPATNVGAVVLVATQDTAAWTALQALFST